MTTIGAGRSRAIVSLSAALLIVPASPAQAQTVSAVSRREVSVTIGGSFGDGNPALASALGLGYRLTPRLGIGVELTHARKLDFTLDLCPAPLVCVRGGHVPVTGRTVSLVPHVAIDLLPATHSVRLYLHGGVGAGHVRQRWFDGSSSASTVESTRSSLTLALSVGAGAMLPVTPRLAVGAEVRSLYLFDEDASPERFLTPSGALRTVRLGCRISWRF